jgi:hypothetical protein
MPSLDQTALRAAVDNLVDADDLVCGRCPGFVVTGEAVPNPRHFHKLGERDEFVVRIDDLAALAYQSRDHVDDYTSLLKQHGNAILKWRQATSNKLLGDAVRQTAISVPSPVELWQHAEGAAAVLVPIGWQAQARGGPYPRGLTIVETSALDWREVAIVKHGQGTYHANRKFDVRSDGPSTVISIGAFAARLELSQPTTQLVTIAQLV